MRSLRTAAAALAAIATTATPLATATTADAAGQAVAVIALDVDWYGVAFSPNGDHSQDKARIAFTLARKSEVIVKIRRTNEARTLVYKEKLGKVTRGDHTWVWNGKNRNGKVVKDGHYTAILVADQVAEDGKKQSRGTAVYVDTTFDATWAPRTSADTVYPNTAGYPTDFVGLTLGNVPDDPMTSLGKVAEIVTDAEGRVVSKQQPFQYLSSGYYYSMPLSFRGRDAANDPLPAGTYGLRFTVRDLAGNPGGTKTVTVNVSDRPLVEATGYVVVAPTAASVPAGRSLAQRRRRRAARPVRHRGALRGVRRPGCDELPLVRRLRGHLGPAQPRDSRWRRRPGTDPAAGGRAPRPAHLVAVDAGQAHGGR